MSDESINQSSLLSLDRLSVMSMIVRCFASHRLSYRSLINQSINRFPETFARSFATLVHSHHSSTNQSCHISSERSVISDSQSSVEASTNQSTLDQPVLISHFKSHVMMLIFTNTRQRVDGHVADVEVVFRHIINAHAARSTLSFARKGWNIFVLITVLNPRLK